jgi:hypothetical protein
MFFHSAAPARDPSLRQAPTFLPWDGTRKRPNEEAASKLMLQSSSSVRRANNSKRTRNKNLISSKKLAAAMVEIGFLRI